MYIDQYIILGYYFNNQYMYVEKLYNLLSTAKMFLCHLWIEFGMLSCYQAPL